VVVVAVVLVGGMEAIILAPTVVTEELEQTGILLMVPVEEVAMDYLTLEDLAVMEVFMAEVLDFDNYVIHLTRLQIFQAPTASSS
jgi:hypothetical protein